jgi:predicted DNA-binding transcriptional regulator AlpA
VPLDRLVPTREVLRINGDQSKAALYAKIKRGGFPPPVEPGLWSEAQIIAHQKKLAAEAEAKFAARSRSWRARLVKETPTQ